MGWRATLADDADDRRRGEAISGILIAFADQIGFPRATKPGDAPCSPQTLYEALLAAGKPGLARYVKRYRFEEPA